ncbi:glycosyltransferase [Yokenella regensburgei]|uniref:glycosyltransferase n=1 Tax=Yokenella regensburgei TaxID=158877 RepID=UPI003ED95E76
MTLLTIIIPVYNAASDIEKCVLNIESTIPNLLAENLVSVLVKDGLSRDETVEVVKGLTLSRPWLSIVSQSDGGVYDAMNQAVAISESRWVFFLGADDELVNGFNKIPAYLLDDTSCECVHYFNVLLKKSMCIYDGYFSKVKLLRKNICHQGIVYPKKLLVKFQYNQKYKSLGDWALNITLFNAFIYHDETISLYNDISGLSKEYRDIDFIKDKPIIFKKTHGMIWYLCAVILNLLGKVKNALR